MKCVCFKSISVFPSKWCVSHLSITVNKIPEKNNLKKRKIYFSSQFQCMIC